jgi:hypothetical protein
MLPVKEKSNNTMGMKNKNYYAAITGNFYNPNPTSGGPAIQWQRFKLRNKLDKENKKFLGKVKTKSRKPKTKKK